MVIKLVKRKYKKIGIDIDGVVCDVVPSVLLKCKGKYNINLKKENINDWNYKNHKFELENEIKYFFAIDDFILNLPPIEYAKESISFLKKRYKIIFVTSRWDFTRKNTKIWIAKHFGKTPIIFERQKEYVNVDLLIDDKYGQVSAFSNLNDKPSILFSQPWNEMFYVKKPIIRCRNWIEILLYFITEEYKEGDLEKWESVMDLAKLIKRKQ